MFPKPLTSVLSTLQFIARHPLSSRNKLAAYWRYAKWQIESRLRSEIEYEWIDGVKLVSRNGMTGATGNIYCGLHEFEDMAFLLHLLRPDDIFVDVGANIGSYTVLASGVCKARSISVEPDPGTIKSLRRNVSANRIEDRVMLIEAALGASLGSAQLTIGRDTTNQIVKDSVRGTQTVRIETLDNILKNENPILIKMDVEGFEAEVVIGAVETLARPSLMGIITENAEIPVMSALEARGFHRAIYEPFKRELTRANLGECSRGGNSLFVRDIDFCNARLTSAPYRLITGQYV